MVESQFVPIPSTYCLAIVDDQDSVIKVVTRTVRVARKPCYIGYLCQGSKQKCIHARYSDALESKANQILTVYRYHAQEQRLLAE